MESKFQINAKVIQDSVNPDGVRITTFELEYHRYIHAEFMTHRLFSRNAASSRAIPVQKALERMEEYFAMPTHWGKNQPGMKAREEHTDSVFFALSEDQGLPEEYKIELTREQAWCAQKHQASHAAKSFSDAGYHKQIVNRLTEPFSTIKVICTATEYDNFFWLRDHEDAQPEIRILAKRMKEAYNESTPFFLKENEWHLPYIDRVRDQNGSLIYYSELDGVALSLEDAKKVSASCCAQVSYRKNDTSIEKATMIYDALVAQEPPHFSPFEHQAMVPEWDTFDIGFDGKPLLFDMPAGITHMDRAGNMWSGNFRGWVQNRQLIMEEKGISPMSSQVENARS